MTEVCEDHQSTSIKPYRTAVADGAISCSVERLDQNIHAGLKYLRFLSIVGMNYVYHVTLGRPHDSHVPPLDGEL